MATFTPIDLYPSGQDSAVSRAIAQGKAGGKRPKGVGSGEATSPELDALAIRDAAESDRNEELSYTKPGEVITSTPQTAQDRFTPIDLGESQPGGTFTPIDLSGGNPGPSSGTPEGKKPFHPHQLLDLFSNSIDPELKFDILGQPPKGTVDPTQPFHPMQWIGRIGDAAKEIAYDTASTLIDIPLTPATYLTNPFVGSRVRTWPQKPPIDITPKTMTPDELKLLVQKRQDYPESVGHPDQPLAPQTRQYTGEVVYDQSLVPGTHPIVDGRTSRRDALGNKVRLPSQMQQGGYPTVAEGQLPLDMQVERGVVGEKVNLVPPGAQGELLGGPFNEAETTDSPFPRPYRQDEQTEMGLIPLRPQRYFPPMKSQNPALANEVARELREPSIDVDEESGTYWDPVTLSEVPKRWDIWRGVRTKEEQALLDTIASEDPRLSRHGIPVEGHYLLDNKAFSMNDPIVTIPGTSRTAHAGVQVDERFSLPEKIVLPTGEVKLLSGQVRASGAVTDVMRKAGTAGRMMADMIDNAYETASAQFGSSENRLMKALADQPGKRPWLSRKLEGVKTFMTKDGEGVRGDPTRRSLVRERGFTQAEADAIWNYMYTGGKWPASERVKQGADDLFRELHALSSDPAFREIEYKNALTGEMVKAGNPSLHMPQLPRNAITVDAINAGHWKILYIRHGGEASGKTLEQFKHDIVAISRGDNEAGTYQLHNWTRTLDLSSLGGSPVEWARKLGYESDPLVATLRAIRSGYLRGQLKSISQPINDLLGTIPSEAADTKNWLDKAAHAALLEPHTTSTTDMVRRNIQKAMQVINIGSLQLSGVLNYGQIIYPVARAGMLNSTKGFLRLFSAADRDMMRDAGVLVPNMLTKLHNTQGAMAVYASLFQHSYGTSMSDRHIRVISGLIGDTMIAGIEKSFLNPPLNPVKRLFSPSQNVLKHNIEELGGDPQQILLEGKIPETMRLKMIQRFANYTAGISDVRGVPLLLLSDSPWAKFRNLYQTYAGANMAESRRLIENAPNKREAARRIVTLFMGATTVGTAESLLMHELEDALTNDPTPWEVDGRFVMEATAMGLFNLPAVALVAGLRDPGHAVSNLIGGVPGGYANGIWQDLVSTMEHGFGWGSFEHIIRKTPAGKLLGPPVREKANEERELRRAGEEGD